MDLKVRGYKVRVGAVVASVCTCLSSAAAAPSAHAGTGAIFMYHHVSPTVARGPYARALTVTPDEFRAQLIWLAAHGCTTALVDQLLRDAQLGRLAPCEAALTFDDGYDDGARFALPLLERFHAVATFYVSTGLVGSPGHLSTAQLRALRAAGMEIGAHTVHHVDLTAIGAGRVRQEIDASAAALRAWLGTSTTTFAYPSGKFNRSVIADVRAASFGNAVTTEPGHVVADQDPYELPRYRVLHGRGTSLLQRVFGIHEGVPAFGSTLALHNVARRRIAGNDPAVAEDIAVALLARSFPEQILKVHVLALPPASVAGIVLSGIKLHRARSRAQFAADVASMVSMAYDAAPHLAEVDVWATVPVTVAQGAAVSGDYAVPASKTVFSAAVSRAQIDPDGRVELGSQYWDPVFLR